MLDISNLSSHTESELINWLLIQDDLYENEGDSDVDDVSYDLVRRYAQLSFPGNKYFTGVGANVRGGKVALPFAMNGLVQLHPGEVYPWASQLRLSEYVTVSDKLDGTSAQVIYDADGNLQIAFSRGNGVEAADITRHIKLIPNIPNKIPATGRTVPVRLEVVIPKSLWSEVQSTCTRKGGEQYKNARGATAGIMNSSSNDPNVYQYLRGVAYTIIDSPLSKQLQLTTLEQYGFEIARHSVWSSRDASNETKLTYTLNGQRATSKYEIDGLVLNVDDVSLSPGVVPAIKYKVADESNVAIATVKEVVYAVSKDGYIKPRVNIFPIQLAGITVNYATGFNAGFINNNKIGPGAKIRITRSGDVIPFIMAVVEPAAAPQLPDIDVVGQWVWSSNNVDAILTDLTNNRDVAIQLMVDIFTKLNVAHLKGGNVEKLYDAGYKTAVDVIKLDYVDIYMLLGEVGAKIHDSMQQRLSSIYWPEFMGSMNVFGRGIGRRKLTKLYNDLSGDLSKMRSIDHITAVEGFDEKTAGPIVKFMDYADDIIQQCAGYVTVTYFDINAQAVVSGTKMAGQVVVFTGVRSAELEAEICKEGGEIGSGVSGSTTIVCAKDVASSSGKVKKARTINAKAVQSGLSAPIQILDIKQLEKMLIS